MPKDSPTSRKATPRQKKLVQLMPQVEAGVITMESAFKKAGYSDATAKQQSNTLGAIRKNTVMQEALNKAGVTEELIADQIRSGISSLKPGSQQLGYIQTAAELRDAFPSKKIDHTVTTVDEMLDQAEGEGEHVQWKPE